MQNAEHSTQKVTNQLQSQNLDFRTLDAAKEVEKSMLAAIVTRDDSTVFVKITAKAASLDAIKPGFLSLTKSLHGADH